MSRTPGYGREYEAGMAAFSAHRYEDALAYLEPLADGHEPQNTVARFYVSLAHLRLGMQRMHARRFAAAAEHFRRAASVNPVTGGLCRYLATCYIALHRDDLAAEQLAEAGELAPEDVDTRIRHALATWTSGRPDRAREILREGLALRPDDPELLYQLGVMLAGEDRYDEAIEQLERCVRLAPDHGRAHLRLAQCLGVVRRTDAALEHLQHAQRIDPNDAMVAFQLSLLYGQVQGQSPARTPSFRMPIVLDVHDRRAIDRLAAIIQENPDFLDAFLSLPVSEADEDVFGALRHALERAIERCPHYADLRHRYSQVFQRLGRLEEAVTEAERALAINPRYVNALIQLAQLYQATDRQAAAIERLQQAIALGADYPDVHYLLGRMYQAAGRIEAARSAYERALQLNDRFDAARQALAALAA